jgi:hypothetical protein
MFIRYRTFWEPKRGSTSEQYEDAFFPGAAFEAETSFFRCAIADGATEAVFSKLWARLITKHFAKRPSPPEIESVAQDLPGLQKKWLRLATRRPLPWYVDEKLRAGSFASLLWLELNAGNVPESEFGELHAIAAGDSCLAQVRQEEVVCRFPLEHSAQFSSRPVLLPSNPVHNDSLSDRLKALSGAVQRGDQIFLMTDALACWFYAASENGQKPWEILRGFEHNAQGNAFAEWIGTLRADHEMKNDDVTLVRIEVA